MSEPTHYAFVNTGVFASYDGINYAINTTASVNLASFGNCLIVSANSVRIGNLTVYNTLNSTAWTGIVNVASVTAGGSNTHVQFNDSGSFNGNSGFTFNKATNNVLIANTLTVGTATVNSTFYSQTSNNTSFVGSVSAANVVSNAQLIANLANYTNTAGLSTQVLFSENMVLNADMEISQIFGTTSTSVVGSIYGADQWVAAKNGSMVGAIQQVTDAPNGYPTSLKFTISTANTSLAAGDYFLLYQPIEGVRTAKLGFGTSSASSVTIGFWAKTHRTGTYSGVLKNAATTRSYPFPWTINSADTWEYKTILIPGDTSGTWVGSSTAHAMTISFAMAAGSTFLGTANTWASTNYVGVTGTLNGLQATSDTFQITGVTMFAGDMSTALTSTLAPKFQRGFDAEYPLCMRYYEKTYEYAAAPGNTALTGSQQIAIQLSGTYSGSGYSITYKVPKRTVPTITTYATQSGTSGKLRDYAASADINSSVVDPGIMGARAVLGTPVGAGVLSLGWHWVADARM